MKYILKLLPLLLVITTINTFAANQKNTGLNAHLVRQALERRAEKRGNQAKPVIVTRAPQTQKKQAVQKVAKTQVPVQQPKPKPAAAPIKVMAIQHAQTQVQAQAAEKMSLDQILVHLDEYVESVFSCIKRFLSPTDKGTLKTFAHEIETYVKKLDHNVLTPLQSMQEPVAHHLRVLAQTLKHNQCEFKSKLTGGYKNAMSLGLALLNLKKQTIAHVNQELAKCSPGIRASHLAAQFGPIEEKIIALTNYTVSEMQAIKVLHKRI